MITKQDGNTKSALPLKGDGWRARKLCATLHIAANSGGYRLRAGLSLPDPVRLTEARYGDWLEERRAAA